MRGIINKNIDYIETFQESEPKELSKDEVAELVRIVKKEISGRFESLKRYSTTPEHSEWFPFRHVLDNTSSLNELSLVGNDLLSMIH
ncbi:MAG: hypothetical protein WAM26_06285 [Nitrososphaeraceae archaeon]